MSTAKPLSSKAYKSWLTELKTNIGQARFQTSLQINTNMLMVYWYLGKQLSEKVEQEKWGAKVLDRLAIDLQKAFPDTKGFSYRNLKYMKQFAEAYHEFPIGQALLAQLKNSKTHIAYKKQQTSIAQQLALQLKK